MIVENKNRPAYPISEEETDRIEDGVLIYTGLTKREYFAGLAMQGYLSSIPLQAGGHEWIAENSVKMADALLKELNK